MEKEFYIEVFHTQTENFGRTLAGQTGKPALPVPTTPGWSVNDLLIHVGAGQRRVRHLLGLSQEATRPDREDYSMVQLAEPYLGWLKNPPAPPDASVPAELVTWYSQGAIELEKALRDTAPDRPTITFGGSGPAMIWFRIQATEISLHRWDLENACGMAQPVDPEMARDAIDFRLENLPGMRMRARNVPKGEGESYHLHCTDGPGEWLIRFEPESTLVTREHAKGDLALRGNASDLLLFLWGRQDASTLEVIGRAELIERYFELAPAF